MEEDEAIKRITQLLEMGGTMLATHHDCGAPLFRYKGNVVCPICSFDEVGNVITTSQKLPSEQEPASKIGPEAKTRENAPSFDAEGSSQIPEGAGTIASEVTSKPHPNKTEASESGMKNESNLVKDELRKTILHKLGEISMKMRDEQDLARLKSQLKCIDEALKVLESLDK